MSSTQPMSSPPLLKGRLTPQAWMTHEDTVHVMSALLENGGNARFVGGCVRDALANRPVVDVDIATPLDPETVTARLARHKIKCVPTGLQHGTVTAVLHRKSFEITTLRIDVATYGRHADVRYTDDWRQDALRRDFTINAMSATLEGDVFDPFDGITHLREGRVLFVGDPETRITEDYLRILRYFRFLAHFGRGRSDAAALTACGKHASKLTRLSGERMRREVLKLLESNFAATVWRLMIESRVVTHFLPEATGVDTLERLIGLEEKYHSDGAPLRRLAAVLDVTKEGLETVIETLRLSHLEAQYLMAMIVPKAPITTTMTPEALKMRVYQSNNDRVRSQLLLNAAKTGAENALPALYQLATAFQAPTLPVNGADVMDAGVAMGPDVGRILKKVESWWMDCDFKPGRTECLQQIKALRTTK